MRGLCRRINVCDWNWGGGWLGMFWAVCWALLVVFVGTWWHLLGIGVG